MELDQLRQEITLGLDSTQYLRVYPKVAGTGAVTGADAAAYALADAGGNAVASGTVNFDDTEGAYLVPVAPADYGDPEERCKLTLDWVYSGTTYRAVVLFDVVRHPYAATSLVGLADLEDLEPYAKRHLVKLANQLGVTGTDTAKAEALASRFAYQARVEVDGWVRAAATDLGTTRPAAVLDRTALARVERLMALALMYNGMGGGPESEAQAKAKDYKARAQEAWRTLGPVAVDTDQDLVEDATTDLGAQLVVTRRRQAP